MTEHEIQNSIRAALSDYGVVFRMNAGTFWQGRRVWSRELRQTVLTELRAVEGLPAGFPDLLFLDEGGAAFIEVKAARGKKRQAQENFIRRMQDMGHRAGFARSAEQAIEIIKGGKQE